MILILGKKFIQKIFEDSKVLGPALKELVKELLLIKPTSVDSERAFSICAMIDTRYRAKILPEKVFQNSFHQPKFVSA